jgi:hypothetical protein
MINTMHVPHMLHMSMLLFADSIIASRPPDAIIGPVTDPYVHRWHLGPRGDAANCYVHIFYRDDVDRALHDHRYDNTSVVLRNDYLEHFHEMPLRIVGDKYATMSVLRKTGDVVHRRATEPHRVSLVDGPKGKIPVTTIFFTGEAYRQWGFAPPSGWVPWKEYHERIGAIDGKYKGVEET